MAKDLEKKKSYCNEKGEESICWNEKSEFIT
jgi:hypothetical protein